MLIIKKWFNEFTIFEKSLIGVNILISIIFLVIGNDYIWLKLLGFTSSISTIIYVVLVAKKKISCFRWGIIGSLAYIVVAFKHGNTGEWSFQAFYYLPMIMLGWYLWAKNKSQDDNSVVLSKKLNLKQSLIIYSSIIIGAVAFAKIISLDSLNLWLYGQVYQFGFDKYLTDSLASILAIPAMILMVKRYREQWLMWIVLNIVNIRLWLFYTPNSLMVLMWTCMLVNSIYGWLKWKKVNN
ncbi:MAG: nicotinamide riboside transporter PnuC [Alphaproteobacteria bacterium]|jgi:nicotinamide mononucleotide transporter|nr:nicotinamide riboside transporter PnuC [Alphaproteobacteria bacterium]